MLISEIIKQVRFCIDEEYNNEGLIVDPNQQTSDYMETENTKMDRLIRSKIGDSLKWCALYAPAELLEGSTSTNVSTDYVVTTISGNDVVAGNPVRVKLPNSFIRLVRVRLPEWQKAVRNPIEEDSEEYLMLSDDTAEATTDRPVAALVRKVPMELELYPGGNNISSVEISFVNDASGVDYSLATDVNVPTKIRSSFLYYLAYLVMCAYDNPSKAQSMLGIAKLNLGINT